MSVFFLRLAPLAVDTISVFLIEIRDYGLSRAILLNTILPQGKLVITRIRDHVLESTTPVEEALAIRNSYRDSFNMIAVAAAISAQIAITALSLIHIEEVHWTATAAFLASLIYGLFAVYFSCLLQLKLGSLHRGKDVLAWLVNKNSIYRRLHSRGIRNHNTGEEDGDKDVTSHTVASFSAVMMLVAPSQLLNWSLSAFIIGIGIYYGQIYSIGIGTLPGQNANLAILLVYVLVTIGSAIEYFLPLLGKTLEWYESALFRNERFAFQDLRRRLTRNLHGNSKASKDKLAEPAKMTAATDEQVDEKQFPKTDHCAARSIEVLTEVFQESIRLQEANLKAMQDLIKVMTESKQFAGLGQATHARQVLSSQGQPEIP